jgi:hypothetical protein
MTKFDVWKDLDAEITLVVTFFLFLKISANLIEFVFTMLGISTPEIISPSFLVTLQNKTNYLPSYIYIDNTLIYNTNDNQSI